MASHLQSGQRTSGEPRSPRGPAALVALVLALFVFALAAPGVHLASHALGAVSAAPAPGHAEAACAHDAASGRAAAGRAPQGAVDDAAPLNDACGACALLGAPASPSLAPDGADLGVRDRATGPPAVDVASADRLLLDACRARAPPLA